MSEREKLLLRISQYGFAMWELHLFLDSHPNDKTAMAMLEANKAKHAELTAEYVSKYGPLNTRDVTKDNRWLWIADPWPWEYSPERGL